MAGGRRGSGRRQTGEWHGPVIIKVLAFVFSGGGLACLLHFSFLIKHLNCKTAENKTQISNIRE